MTKAQLRAAYLAARDKYSWGEVHTTGYALQLDTMLPEYFGLPLLDPVIDGDGGQPAEPGTPD